MLIMGILVRHVNQECALNASEKLDSFIKYNKRALAMGEHPLLLAALFKHNKCLDRSKCLWIAHASFCIF